MRDHDGASAGGRDVKIGCGCVNLGSASSRLTTKQQIHLIRSAFDAGVTVFDTSNAYGAGASERLLGRALADRRDEVTLSTKGGYISREQSVPERRLRAAVSGLARRTRSSARPTSTEPPSTATPRAPGSTAYRAQDFSPAALRRSIEGSLRRLGTDRIDVYQLHGPRDRIAGLFEELEDLRAAGTIGRWGIGAESHAAALRWCDEPSVDVVQIAYGILDIDARTSVLPAAAERSIDVWARGVLGGGVLGTAMRDPDAVVGHEKHALISSLLAVADQADLDLDELAIRWVRSMTSVSTMLLGMSSTEHLERNLTLVSRPPLSNDVLLAIDVAIAGGEAK